MSKPAVGDPASDLTLPDRTGRPVSLAGLWTQAPLVLFFLRHFG